MKRTVLVAVLLSMVSGCALSRFDRGYACTYTTTRPTFTVNGEPVEYNKELVVWMRGQPTYTIPLEGAEACIWRTYISKDMPRDDIAVFDCQGNYLPADPHADYGLCSSCGEYLRGYSGTKCPHCGAPRKSSD